MLYWFRTPPGVKVGRAALDEDAIRLIEQLNPGIEFDWTRILKGQGAPATEPRPPIEARRQRPDHRRPRPSQAAAPARTAQPSAATRPIQIEPVETSQIAAEPEPTVQSEDSGPVPGPNDAFAPDDVESPVSQMPTPAHAKLGAEGVQRLRARYAEILVRISERTTDPLRREELKYQADRLNPDSWVTDEEVGQGLEQYESVFASLREVIGQKRRRRRRGSRPRSAEPGGVTGDPAEGPATDMSADSAGPSDSPEDPEDPEDDEGDEGGDDPGPGES